MFLPRSSVPGFEFPALPAPQASLLMAVEAQLERSQWWSAGRMREQQLRQAAQLVAHAVEHSPWYQRVLSEAGVDAAGLDEAAWSRIPRLGRSTVQSDTVELRARTTPPEHGKVFEVAATSGSLGRPVRIYKTSASQIVWHALTLCDFSWHGWDARGTLAVIRVLEGRDGKPLTPGTSLRAPSWGPSFHGLYDTGPSVALPIDTDVAEQLDWLERERPDYLLTYPNNLASLLDACARAGRTPPRLRGVRTVAEALDPMLRSRCNEAFGCELIDSYSCGEAGYLALQCPQGGRYHVMSEGVLVEVLDDDGRVCAPGEVGQVVVTPLHNFATPLLRYVIGDLAEVGETCECGRGLPVLARVVGRTRSVFVLPDGRRIYPRNIGQSVVSLAPAVRQVQLVQHTLSEVEVRIAPRALSPDEEAAIRRLVQDHFDYPFEVRFSVLDELPRGRGGKFEDFVSLPAAAEAG